MAEWYDASVTARTYELYDQVKAWAKNRNDVSVIGGVGVWELVKPAYRMRSRDIDIVLHSNEALHDFESQFPKWGIAWRRKGRSTFKECRFVDADPYPPIIDVFTTDAEIGARLFTMHRSENVTPEIKGHGFLPALPVLLQLKVRAVPQRSGADADDKRAKDLLDIYHLVFHNDANEPPLSFLAQVEVEDRRVAAKYVAAARRHKPAHREAYDLVLRWLKRERP